jgi:hypothetical protein
MGLLDDAIREHLELKRRRGADSSEVARQEQEALGPPRRGDLEHAALDEPGAFAEESPRTLQAVQDAPRSADDDGHDEEPATRVHRPVEPVEHAAPPAAEEDHEVAEEPPAPAPPTGGASGHSLGDEGGQPTREFDAQELRAATDVPPRAPVEPERARPAEPSPRAGDGDEEPEEEDVLEETPEFLQETPEHDRLWFEQRPPRDFDF